MWLKRAALIGEAVLLIQLPLFAWQVWRQDRDTTIVRRAQLLATVYDCAEPGPVAEPPPGVPELPFGPTPEICPPKAHPRARAEAVRALAEIDGTELDLISADLSGLDLSGANLSGANLVLANLSSTDLSGANLSGANLVLANLTQAILLNVDLREALLGEIVGPIELRADLSGAVLVGANLTQAQVDSANTSAKTQLPEGLTRPDHWLETDSIPDSPPSQGQNTP